MKSDFSEARRHLEQAWTLLPGHDDISTRSRQALDILIEVVATAEHAKSKETAEIIPFPKRAAPRFDREPKAGTE